MNTDSTSLVSIVLPIYNGEKYMRQSIESVINQTYKNWELIIIDDCSSDNTPHIAKEYANQDNRIKYYRNETNLKLPRGLNRGFSLSKGEYLTWTSDDNMFNPNAIEVMVDTIKTEQVELVYASYDIIDENDNITVYVSNVDRSSGEPKLLGVDDEEEWNRVKDVLRELSKSE